MFIEDILLVEENFHIYAFEVKKKFKFILLILKLRFDYIYNIFFEKEKKIAFFL